MKIAVTDDSIDASWDCKGKIAKRVSLCSSLREGPVIGSPLRNPGVFRW